MTTHTPDELNLDPELRQRIKELAERKGRPASDVVWEALRAYEKSEGEAWIDELHEDERYLAAVDEGIRSADEEPLEDPEEVKARVFARLGAVLESRRAP